MKVYMETIKREKVLIGFQKLKRLQIRTNQQKEIVKKRKQFNWITTDEYEAN